MRNKHQEEKLQQFREKIAKDDGLNRVSKQVTYTSLICLALTLSGASINKANTFLFEINFESPRGLAVLLTITAIFLLIRYHGYAYSHFDYLKQLSEMRFKFDPKIIDTTAPSGTLQGVLGRIIDRLGLDSNTHVTYEELKISPTLKLKIEVTYEGPNGEEGFDYIDLEKGDSKISKKEKIAILKGVVKSKILNYMIYQDHLNLLAPYFIGVIAIATMLVSFIKPDLIPGLIQLLS